MISGGALTENGYISKVLQDHVVPFASKIGAYQTSPDLNLIEHKMVL